MKKIFIILLLITLNLHQGYFLFCNENDDEFKAENRIGIDENVVRLEEDMTSQSVSFNALESPYVFIKYKDIQIEGLLIGIEADSILIDTVLVANQESKDHLVVIPDSVLFEKSSKVSHIQRIAINDMHHITVVNKSKFGELLGYGILIGAGTGLIIGLASGDDKSGFIRFTAGEKALMGSGILGSIGGILGGLTGLGSGRDSTYDLNNQNYIQKIQVIRRICGYEN